MTASIALNAPAGFSYSPAVERGVESTDKITRADITRGWWQLALIISSIATAIILSAAGVLPAAVLTVAKIAVLSTAVSLILVILKTCAWPKTEEKEGKFDKFMKKVEPFDVAVKGPIIEEVLFRGMLQGGLQWGLKRALPTAVMSVLGLQLPVASVIAAVAAGSVFGLVHLTNEHEGNQFQAMNAALRGIFVEGGLFAVYGLWASCLAHIMNNTFAATVVQGSKSAEA